MTPLLESIRGSRALRWVRESFRRVGWLDRQALRMAAVFEKRVFRGSADYWQKLYVRGGNSGPGSYGHLAVFKAEVLNRFIADHDIGSVLEFGCGDGNQLRLLECPSYIGLDISRAAVQLSAKRFSRDGSKSFYLYDPFAFVDNHRLFRADLSISLDVIYHLVEDDVYERYMSQLFASAKRFVIIYATNSEMKIPFPHVRARRFTDWTDRRSDWRCVQTIANKYPYAGDPETGSFSDFYIFERI